MFSETFVSRTKILYIYQSGKKKEEKYSKEEADEKKKARATHGGIYAHLTREGLYIRLQTLFSALFHVNM